MQTDPNIESTIAKAVNGDRQATEQLFLRQYDRLESRIGAMLPASLSPLIQVEDIIQETFVHAIRSLPQCRAGSLESFTAWLDTVAENRVLDAIRLIKSKKRGGDHFRWPNGIQSSSFAEILDCCKSESTPGRAAARLEAIHGVNSAIEDLPSDERDAVRLRYLQGASLDETAQAIHRSPAAVRGLLHRAKKRLREIMLNSSRWFDKR